MSQDNTTTIAFTCGHSMDLPKSMIEEMPTEVKTGPCLNCFISQTAQQKEKPNLTPKEKQAKLIALGNKLRDAQASMNKLYILQKIKPHTAQLIEALMQALIPEREKLLDELIPLLPKEEEQKKESEQTIAGLRLVMSKLRDIVVQLTGLASIDSSEALKEPEYLADIARIAFDAHSNVHDALSSVEAMLAILDTKEGGAA